MPGGEFEQGRNEGGRSRYSAVRVVLDGMTVW